jgi:hypothetical protein
MNLGAFDLRGLGIICTSKFGGQEEEIKNSVEKQHEESHLQLLITIFPELWTRIWDPDPYFTNPYLGSWILSAQNPTYIISDLIYYRMI